MCNVEQTAHLTICHLSLKKFVENRWASGSQNKDVRNNNLLLLYSAKVSLPPLHCYLVKSSPVMLPSNRGNGFSPKGRELLGEIKDRGELTFASDGSLLPPREAGLDSSLRKMTRNE